MASLKKRGKKYYIQYYSGQKQKRLGLNTTSYQLAKEKLRQFESSKLRGEDNPLPTKTLLAEVVDRYVLHMVNVKTAKSVQTDVYYLRSMFGEICPGLKVTSRKRSEKAMKRPPRKGNDRRFKDSVIEVS